MASYEELRNLFDDDSLRNKSEVAVVIAANNLLSGTPSQAEQVWAAYVFENSKSEGLKALKGVLATYSDQNVSVINSATDTQFQSAVDALVPSLVIANSV